MSITLKTFQQKIHLRSYSRVQRIPVPESEPVPEREI